MEHWKRKKRKKTSAKLLRRKNSNWNIAPKAMSSSVKSSEAMSSTAIHDSQKAAVRGFEGRQAHLRVCVWSSLDGADERCACTRLAPLHCDPPDSSMPIVLSAWRSPFSRSSTTADSCEWQGAG